MSILKCFFLNHPHVWTMVDTMRFSEKSRDESTPRLTIAERIASLPLIDIERDKNPIFIAEGLGDSPPADEIVDPTAMQELATQVYDELYGPNPDEESLKEYRTSTEQSKIKLFGPDRKTWPTWAVPKD
jgi:hypothetical protein